MNIGRSQKLWSIVLTSVTLTIAACATTTFTSTWKAPDAQRLQWKPGEKVIALVVAKQSALRRSGEASLAAAIDRAGLQGVPA